MAAASLASISPGSTAGIGHQKRDGAIVIGYYPAGASCKSGYVCSNYPSAVVFRYVLVMIYDQTLSLKISPSAVYLYTSGLISGTMFEG